MWPMAKGPQPSALNPGSAKAQITVAIGIPLIYLWFLGIPPGSQASTFGDLLAFEGVPEVGIPGKACHALLEP